MIKVTTENEVSIVDLNGKDALWLQVCDAINADIFELVHPARLAQYKYAVMCVDENGLLKELPSNGYGCFLYGTDYHGQPIVGDLLIAKEGWTPEGMDLVDFTEDELKEQYDLARAVTTHLKRFDEGIGGNV